MRTAVIVGAMVLLAQSALAENSYVCVPDKSVGFVFDRATHKWDYARFSTTGKKYFVSRGLLDWEWRESGSATPIAVSCETNSAAFINCGGHEDVQLNTKSLRYQIIDPIGYTANPSSRFPEGWRAPRIEIGTCSVVPNSQKKESRTRS